MERVLEADTATLYTDDGEIECAVLSVFDVRGQEYIALSPIEGDEGETDEVWFYRFERDVSGGDDHEITAIEDDDEYEMVVDKFDEWLDQCEFEEL